MSLAFRRLLLSLTHSTIIPRTVTVSLSAEARNICRHAPTTPNIEHLEQYRCAVSNELSEQDSSVSIVTTLQAEESARFPARGLQNLRPAVGI
jgi:hypothetical protein